MPCNECTDEARCDRAGLCQHFAREQLQSRPCTCHPADNPPQPCARKYALSECRAARGVAPSRQYLHPSRVDALIAVMEGECDGLAVTRETAEAILHYLDGNAPPAGVMASDGGKPE